MPSVVLDGDQRVRGDLGEVRGDLVAAVADDDHEVLGVERRRGGQRRGRAGAAADRVQHLGSGRLHPGALAGGEDDDGRGAVVRLTRTASWRLVGSADGPRIAPRRRSIGRTASSDRLAPAAGFEQGPARLQRPACCRLHHGGPAGATDRGAVRRHARRAGARPPTASGPASAGATRARLASPATGPALRYVGYGCVASAPRRPEDAAMTPPAPPPRPADADRRSPDDRSPPQPEHRSGADSSAASEQIALALFIGVPFLALLAAVPLAWGWGLGWRDVADRRGHLRRHRPRHHGRLPPLLHPRLVQGRTGALQIALAVAGSLAIEGPVDPLGRRPPQAPQVLRPRGRPALARGATARPCRRLIKGLLYAHMGWLFDAEQTTQRAVRPGPAARTGTSCGSRALFPWLVAWSRCCSRRCSAACSTWSWQGALTAFFWAWLVRVGAAAPRHLVDQLDLPRLRRAARSSRRDKSGNVWWLAVLVVRRVLAQPAPRRPDLRPARRAARPDRLQRAHHLAVREARLGRPTSAGRGRPARRSTRLTGDEVRLTAAPTSADSADR